MHTALIDINNCFVSCEAVMAPWLNGKPVCVLSCNDGCAIARSPAAKMLGVRMGQPAHELRHFVAKQGLILLSANFSLYGDFHRRMVKIIRGMTPRYSVYSVDEVFIDLAGVRDRVAFAQELRARIDQWLGLPSAVGLGQTHGLAKTANKLAKRGEGVVDLSDPTTHAERLASLPIDDVWGVGRKWAPQLADMGITNALQLRDAPGDLILERYGVALRRTQRELQGMPCQAFEAIEPDRKQIIVSRSFGARVEDHASVIQAIATFAVSACAKLRARGLVASAVMITAMTDIFRPELKQHHPTRAMALPAATSDTIEMLRAIRTLSKGFLRAGCAYKRACVVFTDLARPQNIQADLFSRKETGNSQVMQTIDAINNRFGPKTIGIAATGWSPTPKWGMKQYALSKVSTTRVDALPIAHC